MLEHDLFYGFTQEDLSQLLEMLGILAVAIAVILFVINPLIHLALAVHMKPTSMPISPNYAAPIQKHSMLAVIRLAFEFMKQNYFQSLRATLYPTLVHGSLWGGAAVAVTGLAIYGRSTPFCQMQSLTCTVWGEALFQFFIVAIGISAVGSLYDQIVRQKLKGNYYFLMTSAMIALPIATYFATSGWEALFGGNCVQQLSTNQAIEVDNARSAIAVNPQERAVIRTPGYQLRSWETGYCIDVSAPVGTEVSVVSTTDRYKVVLIEGQTFQELSWLGFVLNRKVQLEPFVSKVSPYDLEPQS